MSDWIRTVPGSRSSWSKSVSILLVTLLSFLCQPFALSNPVNGKIVSGSAKISQTSPTRLDVTQKSKRAIIDWRSFSIASGEHTNFQQPSASSVTLNRVRGGKLSAIYGSLTANGKIVLINPNGVLFGNGSQVNVGSLIATTSNITNNNFMEGRYHFDIASENTMAGIDNLGQINVSDGGAVILSANSVINEGLIRARLGHVVLAGTETFAVDFHGDGLLQFELGGALHQPSDAIDSESLETPVVNHGSIIADGGIVEMTAHVADRLVERVINMDGVIHARAVDVQGGTIILSGGNQGVVAVSGTLDASGQDVGQIGGEVKVLGDKVGLYEGAVIDVSGDSGGGTALIGGNFQGNGPEYNARRTLVEEGAVIHTDALSEGNGGKVIVWSDEVTGFYGTISAKGGIVGGDGGFVEVSGKQYLAFDGQVFVNAEQGASGTLLLDPLDLTIVDGFGEDDNQIGLIQDIDDNTLTAQGVLFVQGFTDDFEFGEDFTLNADTLENLQGNIVLQAERDLLVNAALAFTNQTENEMVTFQAGRDLTVEESISTNGAKLHLEADSPHSIGLGNDGDGVLTIAANISTASDRDVSADDGPPGTFVDISTGGDLTLIGADIVIDPTIEIDAGRRPDNFIENDLVNPDGTVTEGGLFLRGGNVAMTSPIEGIVEIINASFDDGELLTDTEIQTVQNAELFTIGEALTGGSIGLGTDAQLLLADFVDIIGVEPGFNNVETLRLVADDILFIGDNAFTGLDVLGVQASIVGLDSDSMTSCDCLIDFFDFDFFDFDGGTAEAPFIGFTTSRNILLGDGFIDGVGDFLLENANLQSLNTDSLFFSGPNITVAKFNPAGLVNTIDLFSSGFVSVVGGPSAFDDLLVTSSQFRAAQGGTLSSADSAFMVDNFTIEANAGIQSDSSIRIESLSGNAVISLGDSNLGADPGFNISNQELAAIDTPVLIIGSTFNGGVIEADNVSAESFNRVELNAEDSVSFQGGPSRFPILEVYSDTIAINADVNTDGNFTLNADTVIADGSHTITTNDGNINFNGEINAEDIADSTDFTVNAGTGNVTLDDVGQQVALDTISVIGSSIDLSNVNTTGNQSYSAPSVTFNSTYITGGGDFAVMGNVFLLSDTNIITNGGSINFDGTINGANELTLSADTTGDILFAGNVGSEERLLAVNIDSARNITFNGSLTANDISASYTGAFEAAVPDGFLVADSLFIDPAADSATLFGTVAGAVGDDAALTVEGPVNDPDFTINGCVIGVNCMDTLPPAAEPRPLPETDTSDISGGQRQATTSTATTSTFQVVSRQMPSDDPTLYTYSNFGNEELWNDTPGASSISSFAAFTFRAPTDTDTETECTSSDGTGNLPCKAPVE